MKLKSKSSKKKIIIILLCVAAVIAIAGSGYAIYKMNQNNQQDQDTAEFKDANPISEESEEKQQSYEEQKKEQGAEHTEDTAPDAPLTVTFTSVEQQDSIVRVRATVDALVSEGTCTLTLTKNGESVTKTAATFVTAHTSTCQGFDIPTSELSAGTWDVTLEVTKDGRSGRATATVNIS
jgi:cytoskeletal protein RodZ